MHTLPVTQCPSVRIAPDPRRVIAKPFAPRDDVQPDGTTRLQHTLGRILAMSDDEVSAELDDVNSSFGGRHRAFPALLERNAEMILSRIPSFDGAGAALSPERRLVIGAYFTHEYSVSAAALTNPSMVVAPDQSGVEPGAVRFVMSLRAIGEGHVSSIEFRSGTIDSAAAVTLDEPSAFAVTGQKAPHRYDRSFFAIKLRELDIDNDVATGVLGQLPDRFTPADLDDAVRRATAHPRDPIVVSETVHVLSWLAASNYRVSFPDTPELSERVLFPNGPTESNGMEDARFVRFVGDDGRVTYFATYTAFDGHQILPQLLETDDFASFRVATLSGSAVRNKGIALFPRRVGGEYLALGRQDNVANQLMRSGEVRVWEHAEPIQGPRTPWELIQLGNCGSPLETEAGWLVITHGVGPFRRYRIGAVLLDLDDPATVIGHLDEPLLGPADDERDGYVPNVVYSCGSMLHAGHLVIPYGVADVATRVATVPLDALLERLTS